MQTTPPQIKKIVVIGPESTGKSSLCAQLAAHYRSTWVPEYAREHLLTNGNDYTYDDLLLIAQKQIELEEQAMQQFISSTSAPLPGASQENVPLFIDTDMYVMKVWCEYVFKKCHPWILNQLVNRKYDLYLLCNVDIAWIKDELREYPDLDTRAKLYHHYKDAMVNQSTPWIDVSGDYEQRLKVAISAVDKLLLD
ncbi:MAG: ATP-binding protein [Ferruginibacter sp.]|nr:ATP-binding protein [Ferruginibacter sp.]